MALLDRDGLDSLPPHRQRSARPIPNPSPNPSPAGDRLRPGNDNRHRKPEPTPELDCLIGIMPPRVLANAMMRAHALGTGADRVLIASGAITEADYLDHFARHCGIAIERFANLGPTDGIQLRSDQIAYAAQSGLMPFRRDRDFYIVIAPCHLAARHLMRALGNDPGMATRFRIATAADFDAALLHGRDWTLAHDAAYGLRDRSPALSAAPHVVTRPTRARARRLATSLVLAALMIVPPGVAIGFWSQLLALWFIAAIGLRVAAALIPQPAPPRWARLPDAQMPVYTIIVALYREARVVPQLLRALDALDYPREKLDIILAIEADDRMTRDAIAGFGGMPHRRVIVAPSIGPRTKPKALNCALAFARGSFIAVFDAEDQPDPGQLRAALDVFRVGAPDIACAQAQLCIQNITDSLFTRMFAADYAGQFDAVLPGLAMMGLPLPLGGTSNHFRTDVLRAVGGWDAWNVTEDADLGLRLARAGYRAVTFGSTTQEEAPITGLRWLRQRSRWMKGWMQTLSVHLRDPRRLWRDTGWRGFATLNFILAGPLVSALAYPVLLGTVGYGLVIDHDGLRNGLLTPVHDIAIVSGLLATATIGLIGLARRNRLRDGWILLLTPVYWGFLSIATLRALWQLLRDPYHWEKTEHGLSRKATPRPPRQR